MRKTHNGPGPEATPLLAEDERAAASPHGDIPAGYSRLAAFNVFFYPALGGLLFGYDIGATSAVLEQLKSSTLSGVSWHETVHNSSILQGVITSGTVGGAVLGSLACFRLERRLGRRREILLASVLYALGAAVEWLSGAGAMAAGLAIAVLVAGRVMYGIGVGFAMHGAPAYIGEMSPPTIRGVLVGMKEAFIVLGILLGYIVGYVFEDTEGGWRSVYAVAVAPAVVQFVGMSLMPPSARWLVLVGRVDEARKSLAYVMRSATPDFALEDIQATVEKTSRSAEVGLRALWAPSVKPAMVCGVGLVLLQQITGQPSVLYYADTIFADVGLSSVAAILTGAFKLVATLIAVFTADKRGRKALLSAGCWLMLVALVLLGISFMFEYVSSEDCNAFTDEASCVAYSSKCEFATGCVCPATTASSDACDCCDVTTALDLQRIAILVAMFLYIGGYQVGFGPVVWLMISEIFPLELRGKAISIAVVANFSSNLLVTLLFPVELDLLGAGATFLIFAVVDLVALWFIANKVPETKGLSLEQIEALFVRVAAGQSMRAAA